MVSFYTDRLRDHHSIIPQTLRLEFLKIIIHLFSFCLYIFFIIIKKLKENLTFLKKIIKNICSRTTFNKYFFLFLIFILDVKRVTYSLWVLTCLSCHGILQYLKTFLLFTYFWVRNMTFTGRFKHFRFKKFTISISYTFSQKR